MLVKKERIFNFYFFPLFFFFYIYRKDMDGTIQEMEIIIYTDGRIGYDQSKTRAKEYLYNGNQSIQES